MSLFKKKLLYTFLLIPLFLITTSLLKPGAKKVRFVHVKPKKGEWTTKLFKRYNLPTKTCLTKKYESLNQVKMTTGLHLGQYYKLPLVIKKYNSTTKKLFSTSDYKKIIKYNDWLFRYGRKTNFIKDKILWIPWNYFDCTDEGPAISKKKKTLKIPLFGKAHENITIKSNVLNKHIYYLISGHGGPDPGANTKLKGSLLCEDEYAYDVTLRLARSLLEQGATVYMIVRDNNDGIRDESVLKYDRDEVCYKNKKIPLGQVKRLKQRTDIINKLYNQHKKKKKKQRAIEIHIDSRGSKQIDVFFYHHKNSKKGKKLCGILKKTFTEQYAKHQKGRGYKGSVKPRSLFMLNHSKPVMTYIELGNILHKRDRKRIMDKDNRQALAKWIAIGLLKEAK